MNARSLRSIRSLGITLNFLFVTPALLLRLNARALRPINREVPRKLFIEDQIHCSDEVQCFPDISSEQQP
jgi:hypothetical protein